MDDVLNRSGITAAPTANRQGTGEAEAARCRGALFAVRPVRELQRDYEEAQAAACAWSEISGAEQMRRQPTNTLSARSGGDRNESPTCRRTYRLGCDEEPSSWS